MKLDKLRSLVREELTKSLKFNRSGDFNEGDIIDYRGSSFRVVKDMGDYVIANSMEVFYGDEDEPTIILKTAIGRKLNEGGDMFEPSMYKPEFKRVNDLDTGGKYLFSFVTKEGNGSVEYTFTPEIIGKYGSFTIQRFLSTVNGFNKVLELTGVKRIA